jgi:hypothetical protein
VLPAGVFPVFCRCSAGVFPVFCRCSAAPVFCRCAAGVLLVAALAAMGQQMTDDNNKQQ